jgi:hypothetical protein
MLTDEEAEHIPGCNMVFYKWALEEIGGFDPVFRKAGDDVDVCWRLLERGHRIGFCHAGFVWHYRRSTVRAYLQQQRGYGEAEALLARKHPEYFSPLGGGIWRGRIYSDCGGGIILRRPVIYHGVFASGFFQKLYRAPASLALMLCSSLEYHLFLTLPMTLLAFLVPVLWVLPAASLTISFTVCAVAAAQADLSRAKKRVWSKPLIALLYFLQPLERGIARYRTGLRQRGAGAQAGGKLGVKPVSLPRSGEVVLWSDGSIDRFRLLEGLKEKLIQARWTFREDTGWQPFDLEVQNDGWVWLQLTTTHEDLELGRRNIRCRFRTGWSAKVTFSFWALVVAEVVGIKMIAHDWPWAWMLLLTLPLFMMVIEHREYQTAGSTNSLLQEVAEALGLVVVRDSPSSKHSEGGIRQTRTETAPS